MPDRLTPTDDFPALADMPPDYQENLNELVRNINRLADATAHAQPRSKREPLRRDAYRSLDDMARVIARLLRESEAQR